MALAAVVLAVCCALSWAAVALIARAEKRAAVRDGLPNDSSPAGGGGAVGGGPAVGHRRLPGRAPFPGGIPPADLSTSKGPSPAGPGEGGEKGNLYGQQ